MKIYTRQEKDTARSKLPKPIDEFLGSSVLTDLYVGIKKKLGLDLRQLMMFSEIANTTLLGLEDEHALETNLHQLLPELSNAQTRELSADINDRIFKEAARRLQNNIVEPKQVWDEEELGPKETYDTKPISDVALEKLAAQQEKEGWVPPIDPNEGPDGDIPEDTEEEPDEEGDAAISKESSQTKQQPSIVEEKMGAAVQTKPEQVPAETATSEKQGAATSAAVETPKPVYKGGIDPYREPVE